jgi:hypothetical protein
MKSEGCGAREDMVNSAEQGKPMPLAGCIASLMRRFLGFEPHVAAAAGAIGNSSPQWKIY